MTDRKTIIGSVSGVNPARRELRLKLRPGLEPLVTGKEWIRILLPSGDEIRCKVASAGSSVAGSATVVLAAGTTRDNVARMKHGTVVIEAAESQDHRPLTFDRGAVVGLTVRTEGGAVIGEVTEAFETKAHLVAEVEKAAGGMMLLPLIDEVIVSLDWDERVLVVSDVAPYAVDDAEESGTRLA